MEILSIKNITKFLAGVIVAALVSCSRDNDDGGVNPYTQKTVLTERGEMLESKLSVLPKRNAKWMGERFGYHSVFHDATSGSDSMNEWVQLKLNRQTPVKSLVLVPAVDPQGGQSQSYGFPQRFLIEFRANEDGEVIHRIDYTSKNFDDPGVAPVIIDGLDLEARFIKILVERGQVVNGMEFFAFSEIMVMEQRQDGMVNVAPYSQRSTSADFQSYPYWDIRFIADRLSPLGFPLGNEKSSDTDFIIELPKIEEDQDIEIIFDLGVSRSIGRLAFYPADPPSDILLPHFGYPDVMTIEVFEHASMQDSLYIMEVLPDYKLRKHHPQRHFRAVTDLAFAVPMAGARGRYVKVTASGVSDYNENSILAFGEIIMWGANENLSLNCDVTVNVPNAWGEPSQAKRLVDGYVNSYPVIDTYEWLEGLAKREVLERELASVKMQLISVDRVIEKYWKLLIWVLVVVFSLTVVGLVLRARRARKIALGRLRKQISRDLHDDVGCNLGSISLGICNLKEELDDPLLAEDFEELELITRETSVALEEAIIFTQKNEIYLVDLIERLEQRAKIILEESVCNFTVEGPLQDRIVDFSFKRQVMLLYKEALYNCARHAHASEVDVVIFADADRFRIVFKDNGVGFDMNSLERVSGLDNMKSRALNIGGELTVDSTAGEGTTLTLNVTY